MNDLPAAKIKMMRGSMRCLVFGMFGLVPLIGVPFALASLWLSYSVRRQEKRFWNPAKAYRVLGLVCASLGAFIWSVVDTILIYNACFNYIHS
jgi:hypothetical protein